MPGSEVLLFTLKILSCVYMHLCVNMSVHGDGYVGAVVCGGQ